MKPTTLCDRVDSRLVVTCEHASCVVPDELGDLGLSVGQRRGHIGWDVGAGLVAEEMSARLDAPAVLSSVTRLVVDCNRHIADHDLMPAVSHGVAIARNRTIDAEERERRLREYYDPFHDEVDRVLGRSPGALLLSVHSFTPSYVGRDFEIGVLFDVYHAQAVELAAGLRAERFSVRLNEPYSGLEGLIYSPQTHGRRASCVYLELEINNSLLRSERAARATARRLARAVAGVLDR